MKEEKAFTKIAMASIIGIIIVSIIASYSNSSRKVINRYATYAVQQNAVRIAKEIEIYINSAKNSIQLTSNLISTAMDDDGLENSSEVLRNFAGRTSFNYIEYISGDSLYRDYGSIMDGMEGNTGFWVNFNSALAPEYIVNFYAPFRYRGEISGVLSGAVNSWTDIKPLLISKFFDTNLIGVLCNSRGRVISATFDFKRDIDLGDILDMNGISKEGKDMFLNHLDALNNNVFSFYGDGGVGVCCIEPVQGSDWFVLQVLPASVFKGVVYRSVYSQFATLAVIALIFIFYIVYLSVNAAGNRRKIIAENKKLSKEKNEERERYYAKVQESLIKSEKYKNAVLADAISIFEVNLSQNIMDYGRIRIGEDKKSRPLDEFLDIRFPCTYDSYLEKWSERYIKPDYLHDFLSHSDRNYLLKCAAAGKSEVSLEYPAIGIDGSDRYIRRTVLLTTDEKSSDIIAYCNTKDISEQKNTELQLANYERILITTASDMYSGFIQINLMDYTAVWHYFKDEHIHSSYLGDWEKYLEERKGYIYSEDRAKVMEFLHKEMLINMSYGVTYKINYRGNTENDGGNIKVFTASISKTIIDGKPYALIVRVDSTSTVEVEAAQRKIVEDALSRAEQANMAKSQFLSNMSHDIRTPMNAIVGFSNLAINHLDDRKKTEEYLDKIINASNHLLLLINDVLDMSYIESGKINLDEKTDNLLNIVENIKNLITPDANEKNLKFNVDVSGLITSSVYCDKLRLNQIFLNLLSNAIKFTKPGGKVELLVKEICRDETILYEFHVKDNGIGMGEEFISRIFEPFERERTSTVSGIQGTGLGMSITKRLVDLMHGEINVKSKKGEGSEFIVTLPLKPVPNSDADAVNDGNLDKEEDAGSKKSFERSKWDGKRLLLVEDNALNREIAVAILSEAGFVVDGVEDGTYAVSTLLEKGFGYYSAVLMDIQMPLMDGYEATRKIREFDDKALASIPIIAMTANAFSEDKDKALQVGMNAHIAKPIDVKKLFEVIAELI